MGSDVANIKSGKSSSSNLKVPPLKIVLSSHQNNSAIIDTSNQDDDQTDAREKIERDYIVESDGDTGDKQLSRKNTRVTPESKDSSDLGHSSSKGTNHSSSSSSSFGSDRSTSTSPSSESESLDSNLTIISDNHQSKSKPDPKEETLQNKNERISRHGVRGSSTANTSATVAKRAQDSNAEHTGDATTTSSKEHTLNANQRITRSSQRAAQQNKSENASETNGDDSNVPENQDRATESARKVKRRKGEPQESEQDSGQQAAQQPVIMANICPADYQPPAQNSFELYRDIRKRPYKKMLKLSHVQPKMPHGFKDYLLNSGPYLLDGNRLGIGLSGASIESSKIHSDVTANGTNHSSSSSRVPLRMKLSNLHQKLSSNHASLQRHNSYVIPKLLETPKNLRIGTPLCELFQDQERARHQMKMQHLKERERSILAAEQEILRAYNRVAIANNRQKLHLSACTYFYYQERYHYIDETTDSKKGGKSKEVPHNQDNSNLCIDAPNKSNDGEVKHKAESHTSGHAQELIYNSGITKDEKSQRSNESLKEQDNKNLDLNATAKKEKRATDSSQDDDERLTPKNGRKDISGSKQDTSGNPSDNSNSTANSKSTTESRASDDNIAMEIDNGEDKTKNQMNLTEHIDQDITESVKAKEEDTTIEISDEDLKVINKSVFLDQLQEIDDKWAKIRRDMFIRHKNESDSLFAVQSLEWEWKAKEIGACDVRVTLRIEPEFVPRVEVSALDY